MKILKTLIYIVIALALIVGSYYGWKFYSKAKTPVLDALYILPNDAAVVIGFMIIKSLILNWEMKILFGKIFEICTN